MQSKETSITSKGKKKRYLSRTNPQNDVLTTIWDILKKKECTGELTWQHQKSWTAHEPKYTSSFVKHGQVMAANEARSSVYY